MWYESKQYCYLKKQWAEGSESASDSTGEPQSQVMIVIECSFKVRNSRCKIMHRFEMVSNPKRCYLIQFSFSQIVSIEEDLFVA